MITFQNIKLNNLHDQKNNLIKKSIKNLIIHTWCVCVCLHCSQSTMDKVRFSALCIFCALRGVKGCLSIIWPLNRSLFRWCLGMASNNAALFCCSPCFTQWPYMLNAQPSSDFLMYLYSYGLLDNMDMFTEIGGFFRVSRNRQTVMQCTTTFTNHSSIKDTRNYNLP